MPRLSRATLDAARPGVARPPVRPGGPPGIVHLGLGAFARAHLALYTEEAMAASGETGWGILGVSLRRPDQRDRLAPQDGLYTALERGAEGVSARIVGTLAGVSVAPEDPEAVLVALAAPSTRVVTLTVTEKGYCHDPAALRLDSAHPDIEHDLAHPSAPRSALGFLVEALRRRRDALLPPPTVLCCDNLPANGRLLGALVCEFAARRDQGLAAWIAAEAAFPCCMVDRIVPEATAADREQAAALTGLDDAAVVTHEPFRQWVIEDRFAAGARPAWERAGATLVADVAPFELMKLRLLNGAHSALAYLGYLAGHATIAEAIADPALAAFLDRLWAEILPEVPPPPATDLAAYVAALRARFANPAIRHRTWQIAMDGSQKLPQRLLGTVRSRLARGAPIPCLALVVAAWIRYVGGIDEAGQPIDVRDPLAGLLRARLEAAGAEPAARVRAGLGVTAVFGADLVADPDFGASVTNAYARLHREGAAAVCAALAETHP